MKHAHNSRRTLIAGMVAAIGSGLAASTAAAFPRDTQELVRMASRILHRVGVEVAAIFDPAVRRDVLRFTINPHDDIQYDQMVNGPRSTFPCWLTSSFGDAVEFTNFDRSTGEPDLKIASQGGRSRIEILDPEATVQVTIAGGATYALQDGVLVLVD